MKSTRVHVYISGNVQGVFFRANTESKASELGLRGWVRNLDDGRVEALFEGPKDKIDEMVEWCRMGPIGSRVDNVEVSEEEIDSEFEDFHIVL